MKKGRRIRDEQKGFIFILIILLFTVILSVVFSLSLKTNKVLDAIEEDEMIRVLFVIEDDDKSFLFSNLLIYSTVSKKAAVVNIPNNVGQIFQSLGRVEKIATVYEEKGINDFSKEVEKLLNVEIPYNVVINIEQFTKLTDMIGGMRIFLASPINYVDENDVRYLLPSGVVTLDGDKIYTYLHYRVEEDTNADVQERYQNVMTAFLSGLHEKKYIIFEKENFDRYLNCMSVNLEEDESFALFELISGVDAESIIKQTITGSIRNVDGQQLLFPLNNADFIKEAVKQTTNMLVSSEGAITNRVYVLEIQNGTTVQGLARNTSILFQNASYDVLSAVNADRNDYQETVIIDHLGNSEVAKMVGEFIHCDNIKTASEMINPEETFNSEANVDFTVILGSDFNGRYVIKRKK